jgi:hypothetical protein
MSYCRVCDLFDLCDVAMCEARREVETRWAREDRDELTRPVAAGAVVVDEMSVWDLRDLRGVGSCVVADNGVVWELLRPVPEARNAWFVRSSRGGVLGVASVTSRTMWRETLRMRVDFARNALVGGRFVVAFDNGHAGASCRSWTLDSLGLAYV